MKIAIFQMHIVWKDKKANLEKVEAELGKLQGRGVDLLALPEMSFTGFSMDIQDTAEYGFETMEEMKKLAQKYGLAIGFGWVKDCGEKAENHYSVVNKEGKVISDYAKIHPFSLAGENRYFLSGTTIPAFTLQNIAFSNVICYDLRFPELFQAESQKAHIILVPANWPCPRREHWITLLKARAIENQVYIIGINCVGEIDGLTYTGDSCFINPNGEVLDMLTDEEGVRIMDIPDDVEEYRAILPMKKDRKNELYRALYKK